MLAGKMTDNKSGLGLGAKSSWPHLAPFWADPVGHTASNGQPGGQGHDVFIMPSV